MDTLQLLEAIRSDESMRSMSLGVVPIDCLPDRKRTPSYLIANTDPSDKPGLHWILLHFPTPETVHLFDSYGRTPTGRLLEYMRPLQYSHTMRVVQSYTSTTCGMHCLYMAWHLARGFSMHSVIESYSRDTVANDVMVTQFYRSRFDQSARPCRTVCRQTCVAACHSS